MPRLPFEAEDDELDELPPIDGDGAEDDENPRDLDEIDSPDAGEASLDDSTGEDDPVDGGALEGALGEEAGSGWLDEAVDSPDLDLGEASLLATGDETVSLDDGEEPLAPDEDFGIGEGTERTALDFAEEGPVNADEELREEDLPALDADDAPDEEGRAEEEALLDERVLAEEPLGLAWAAQPWTPVGPALGLSSIGLPGGITAMACAGRGALVTGRAGSGANELVRVDLEGGRQLLPAEGLHGVRVAALAAEGEAIAVVGEGGRLFLSLDGGTRFELVAAPEGVAAADVALASGVLWVRTRTGSLLAALPGKVLERRAVPGNVVSLAADAAGGVVALAVDQTGRPATLVRGRPDGSAACEAVQAPPARPGPWLSARGEHVAYVIAQARGGVVTRSRSGAWSRSAWESRPSGLAIVDEVGTLVVATYSEGDDTTGLVRLDGTGASLVARLGPARDDVDADGRTLALAFDDPHGVVWVAGGFGLAAFAIR